MTKTVIIVTYNNCLLGLWSPIPSVIKSTTSFTFWEWAIIIESPYFMTLRGLVFLCKQSTHSPRPPLWIPLSQFSLPCCSKRLVVFWWYNGPPFFLVTGPVGFQKDERNRVAKKKTMTMAFLRSSSPVSPLLSKQRITYLKTPGSPVSSLTIQDFESHFSSFPLI